jgi:hypothetical protein
VYRPAGAPMMQGDRPHLRRSVILIMRKFLLAIAAIGVVAGAAVPAVATSAPKPANPTGERCVQRVQSSKLSDAGKALATTACQQRAAAIGAARGAMQTARKTHREAAVAARKAYRAAVKAAASEPDAQRAAAVAAARATRRAALKSARADVHAARVAHRAAVKAANQAFRAAMVQARAA